MRCGSALHPAPTSDEHHTAIASIDEASLEQRIEAIQRLLNTAEQAYPLARELHEELRRLRQWGGRRLTPLSYALGICLGDAEISSNRLSGLRSELRDLLAALQREANAEPLPASDAGGRANEL